MPAIAPGAAASGGAAPLADARPAAAATAGRVPLAALPIEIGMRALEGAQSFHIRLHPQDLGQVDVKLQSTTTAS